MDTFIDTAILQKYLDVNMGTFEFDYTTNIIQILSDQILFCPYLT